MKKVWIFNGIPASGKTTTAKEFAKKFPKAALISRDDLQDQIVSGSVRPNAFPKEEAAFQTDMNIRNQCALAQSYLQHGFIPICDDVVGENQLAIYKELLNNNQIHLVTLNPQLDLAKKRDKQRNNESRFYFQQSQIKRGEILQNLVLTVSNQGLWIDNSTISVEETVDYILKNVEQSIV
ncbi:MAG: hypothetical protein CL735_04980 [Chloroflexi bacterium]|nr:hypothetical protein [Chloroflexota bacterium]|tara:strand:- start:7315 stop:7854 length:540 start_codon:yes stop_codon:yes gene_type:complete